MGCIFLVMIRIEWCWCILIVCCVCSGIVIFRSWLIDCKVIRCWKLLIVCEKVVKR